VVVHSFPYAILDQLATRRTFRKKGIKISASLTKAREKPVGMTVALEHAASPLILGWATSREHSKSTVRLEGEESRQNLELASRGVYVRLWIRPRAHPAYLTDARR
jgi:hypothetical protein